MKYFEEKGDGIFLWVELVIRQLAKAKSMSAFKKALEGFSDASGSMDKLYTGVLSRIQEDDWRWIREIIRWLVVAERQVSEQELKDAVEWCLQDGLADFHDFLEVDCGSIVQLLAGEKDAQIVQLVHETFGAFVVKEICPSPFFIDKTETHGYVAQKCLQGLLENAIPIVKNLYCSTTWVMHLSKATSSRQENQLLVSLHGFFTSHGAKAWIQHGLRYDNALYRHSLNIGIENQTLQ